MHEPNLPKNDIFVAMTESSTRVEAFSDVPHGDHDLWAGLRALWPSYIAFVMSFAVILIMWVNHHELLRMVRGVSYPFLFANGVLLLTVTFVPFPTAVLAANLASPDAQAAVAFYCATFVVNALCWNLLFGTIVRGGLLHADVSAATIANVRRTYYVGALVYMLATALAFVRPALGLVLNASLCVVWIRLGYRSESSVSSQPS